MWEHFFKKSIRLDSGGPLLLKSNILSSESPEIAIYRCSRTLKGGEFYEIHFLECEKIFTTSIFLSTSERLLLIIPETRPSLLWIIAFFHFSLLKFRNRMYRSSRLKLIFKIGNLKNFAIFTGKQLCWSLFWIK